MSESLRAHNPGTSKQRESGISRGGRGSFILGKRTVGKILERGAEFGPRNGATLLRIFGALFSLSKNPRQIPTHPVTKIHAKFLNLLLVISPSARPWFCVAKFNKQYNFLY